MSILLVMSVTLFVKAQEPVDHRIIAGIKMEAFQNSEVMETTSYLADVYSPRLTGSPNYLAAARWCVDKLSEWGIENANLEPWGTLDQGWSLERFNIEMTEPQYMRLIAYPRAWTPGTNGVVSGQPVVVEIESKDDFDKYRGKLRGAIVMNGKSKAANPHFKADARRYSDESLLEQGGALNPGESDSYADVMEEENTFLKEEDEINRFFHDEGIAVLLEPSTRDHGVVRVTAQTFRLDTDLAFPALVVAREHYGRILRILEKDIPVQLDIDVRTISHEASTGYNVIAEIPGVDRNLKKEVVMLGGHLDAWHSGTGATDNAGCCAVMMEVMRILKVLDVKPRRTIRMALWDGEEQAYYGSLGYVKKHFGDPETMELLPEHENLSAYFNLDDGTGKIRGIYLQSNEHVRPIFEAYLKPFEYLGASTLTTSNTGGTDHLAFNWVGLPGFTFIQDPIEYGTRTHHTNMDVYEAVLEDDLKQAVAVVATFVYHTAMRDKRLPRKPLPRPPSGIPDE
jgi:hypothetical protein